MKRLGFRLAGAWGVGDVAKELARQGNASMKRDD
jgi:hypothetical protein